jgi:hypothetical protein
MTDAAIPEPDGLDRLLLSKDQVSMYVDETGEADPLEAVRRWTGRDAVWLRPDGSAVVPAAIPAADVALELDRFTVPARESILECHHEDETTGRELIPLCLTASRFEELTTAEACGRFGVAPPEDSAPDGDFGELDAALVEAGQAGWRLSNGNWLLEKD